MSNECVKPEIPQFPELTFEEERHLYYLNGLEVPSVTTLMKPLSSDFYSTVDPEVLNKAARGLAAAGARPTRSEVIWMTEKSEWQFLVDYVKDDTTDFYNDACQNQLVALWTSYCLHNSLDVDTAMYDAVLMDLFNALSDEQKAELHCTGFSELDSMMAQWLV